MRSGDTGGGWGGGGISGWRGPAERDGDDEVINANRPVYRKLIWDGSTITGAVILGPADDVAMLNDMGMIKGLIQAKTDLGAWKQHIQANPTDIRRPYVATRTAEKMLDLTSLGKPSEHRSYQHTQDAGKDRSAHSVFVDSTG